MSESEIFPAPVITVSEGKNAKWERERRAFHRLLPGLLSGNFGKYAAIHEEKVVEIGDTLLETVERAYARFGYVPIFVGLVSNQPTDAVRIPSPRSVAVEGKS